VENFPKPLDKTLVAELKIQIADLYLRNRVLKMAQAAKVDSGNLILSDVQVSQQQPYLVPPTTSFLIVESWQPIAMLTLDKNVCVAQLVIVGMYCHIGSNSFVRRLEPIDLSTARISLCFC